MLLMMWRLLGKWRKICAFSKIRFCAIPAPAFNHLGFCPWLCLLGSTPLLGRIANHNGEQTWKIQTDIWDQLYGQLYVDNKNDIHSYRPKLENFGPL